MTTLGQIKEDLSMMAFYYTEKHKFFEVVRMILASLLISPILVFPFWVFSRYRGEDVVGVKAGALITGLVFGFLYFATFKHFIKVIRNKAMATIEQDTISTPRFRNVHASHFLAVDFMRLGNILHVYFVRYRTNKWYSRLVRSNSSWLRPRIYRDNEALYSWLETISDNLRKAEPAQSPVRR